MATILGLSKRLVYVTLFILSGLIVYEYLIEEIVRGDDRILYFVLLWALTAYIVLPRVHRFLTRFYVPDYFIGRVRTGDGILGDPVNLAVTGSKAKLVKAMKNDGWTQADPLSFKSSWKMVVASVTKKSYPTAPVSDLFLFGKKHDLAFQQEINNNPRIRHHVRFWKVPKGWYLPGGYKVDWVAAATFDRRVGLSLFTGQITHKIAENTDEERDYVASSLAKAGRVRIIEHYSTAYHSRNGGGDSIKTDGALAIADFTT